MLTQDINVIIPLNREFGSLHQPIESFKGSYIATSTLSSPTEHCRKSSTSNYIYHNMSCSK